MKKPAILLVDDDHAVLEALEAAITAAFAQICRIEAFDDPREVLAAFDSWVQEERPLAVAIVDQKMPHCTGIELLEYLREIAAKSFVSQETGGNLGRTPFGPAAHLRSALLTGYAGLDSALAAKNGAGVDRYLEKPWDPEKMVKTVRQLLRIHLEETGAGVYLTLREVRDVPTLEALLRLRYEVVRNGRRRWFLPP